MRLRACARLNGPALDAFLAGFFVLLDTVLTLAGAPDLVATQPQIIYIDTPHDGFGPMGEIQPR
jgi:hypothetical protein